MNKDKKAKNKNRNYAIVVVAVLILVIAAYLVINGAPYGGAANGDNVSVYYSGSFLNGTSFGSNFNSTPLNFTAGSKQMIPGFSNAIIGMKVGQTKYITLQPSQAYGYVNQSLIVNVSKYQFGNSIISVGMIVTSPSGLRGIITDIASNVVTVDFNSPLANKTLKFEIKLLKVQKA